ncbi:hypothetical protein GCM10010388_24670 [Streptomyces mauvecolor]
MGPPVDVPTWVRPNPSAIGGGAARSAACADPAGRAIPTRAAVNATTMRHLLDFLSTASPLVSVVVARAERIGRR